MGVPEIEAFLTHLAQDENVAATTQNQAFNALLFLYRNLLYIELDAPIHALRANAPNICSRNSPKMKLLACSAVCKGCTS
jgi:hypothetical protein